jgi:hypothetical protein
VAQVLDRAVEHYREHPHVADPVAALAMLPITVWQGYETLGEAREHDDE